MHSSLSEHRDTGMAINIHSGAYQHTIAGTTVSVQGVPCTTAAGVGAWGVVAVLSTGVSAQCTLMNS